MRNVAMICLCCCAEWYGQDGDCCPECDSRDTEVEQVEEPEIEAYFAMEGDK